MRVWGRLFGLVVLLFVIVLPGLTFGVLSSSTGSTETTTIKTYRADYRIDAGGDLTVTERLAVDFPYAGKHGIFRFFDLEDGSDSHARRMPEDFKVTRDGHSEPFEEQTSGRGRFVNYQIGSANYTLSSGVHTYVLTYRIDDVLTPGRDGHDSQFYWNLVPGGWRQQIDRAILTVDLPGPSSDQIDCARGFGQSSGCTVDGGGTSSLRVTASDLEPNTPITIRAGVDVPLPEQHQPPWSLRWHSVLGGSLAVAVLIVLLGLLAGWWGSRLGGSTREPTPPFPLQYAPPPGIGPAQGQYILTEKVDKEQFVASLLQAAEQGAASLDKDDTSWTIAGTGSWDDLDEVTTLVGQSLGVVDGGSFTTSRKSISQGERLKSALASFTGRTKGWAARQGLIAQAGLGTGGGALVVLAGAAALAWAIFNPAGFSLLALVPGLFAVGALEFLTPGASTRRTPAGREMWSRLGGFRRVLSTPSSEDRFDFSGRRELYTAYIPWAVAFGVADQWAKKYRVETGEEPPVPAYFYGYTGAHTGNYVDSMISDFSSTMNSAISAYTASQASSSSGGGGGFSGGGGGGGGGGGSW